MASFHLAASQLHDGLINQIINTNEKNGRFRKHDIYRYLLVHCKTSLLHNAFFVKGVSNALELNSLIYEFEYHIANPMFKPFSTMWLYGKFTDAKGYSNPKIFVLHRAVLCKRAIYPRCRKYAT